MHGFTRVYSEKLFEAIQTLPERELRLWLALVAYADIHAVCFPGIAALSAITGYRQENIIELLQALADRGFIEFLRRAQRDPLTRQMMSNVYRVDGIVTTEGKTVEKADSAFELENGVITPPRTDSITQQDSTQQRTPPPNTTNFLESEVPKPNTTAKTGKEKTPERSSIPHTPPQVPPAPSRNFYRGPLDQYAEALPTEQEQAAEALVDRVDRKLPLRLARKFILEYGQANVDIAIAHLAKQTDVRNPAGYVRTLLERRVVEQADAAAADPGRDLAASWGA